MELFNSKYVFKQTKKKSGEIAIQQTESRALKSEILQALNNLIINTYNIEVIISDELSSVTFTANLGSGVPNIALHKNGVGIMGPYNVEEGGLLQIEGKNICQLATILLLTGK